MNRAEFSHIVQNPQAVSSNHTGTLEAIIEKYPYFQSARAIYLKALKNAESFEYNDALKTAAAYTTDRSILFDYITSDKFVQNEISEYIKKHTDHIKDLEVSAEDVSVDKSVVIDAALKQQIKDTEQILDPELFQPKVKKSKIVNFQLDESEPIEENFETSNINEDSPEDILKIGTPLQFDINERHSFNEWLKLTRFKPIDRSEEQDKTNIPNTEENTIQADERSKKFDLIDNFLSKNPKLKPEKTQTKNVNLAEEQMIQPEALMTETLARIYVEQKNYKKAIQSYKILSLKYPEKSGFFADQIKAIKQLQEQNNKEQ
ncbi:hypothetical protein C1T31_05970 [Hanstruepera neustonica]|uniref:Tetratricopeptide repeat protein n=1 Tax=Hanstruepera neustonica TaxID=1445657 RepID=A0A2K1E0S9_9FLAO|nr:hypothetical protein [Hanstruepera neustonica]PNQ73871.1 hypothetical protein C1T31_05970 [Hanstruepera neustonica]